MLVGALWTHAFSALQGDAGSSRARPVSAQAGVLEHNVSAEVATHPAPAIRAVYDSDPTLAFMKTDFTDALRRSVYAFLIGLLSLNEHHG
ncbi:hypothetical protein GCM10018793_50530 [Streptomyces sulfonofaciens]|uniref:Uncharacterized protein n=1 Tax=Streptomyces sulfonofaciens TaxID=68272 RepID=A0A919GHF2_9ACTN|nr:hypothetical protein GCM10018793_50530 [Streptomyces sulfonofaciens]